MQHNDQATLVTVTASGATLTKKETTLFCAKKSVRYSEFYAATQVGINPKYVFEFNLEEYETAIVTTGEAPNLEKHRPTELIYDGETFNIIRTYEPDVYTIEITVGL